MELAVCSAAPTRGSTPGRPRLGSSRRAKRRRMRLGGHVTRALVSHAGHCFTPFKVEKHGKNLGRVGQRHHPDCSASIYNGLVEAGRQDSVLQSQGK